MLYLCVYMHINVYDFCGRHATAYYTLIQMRVLVVLLVAACTCCLSTLAYVRQIRANAYICTSHLLKTMLAESTLYTNTHTQVSTCRCSHIQLYACMHAHMHVHVHVHVHIYNKHETGVSICISTYLWYLLIYLSTHGSTREPTYLGVSEHRDPNIVAKVVGACL